MQFNADVPVVIVLMMSVAIGQMTALTQFLDQYAVVIAVASAVWYMWSNYQWTKLASELTRSVNQIEITSQVVATRANMTDFRVCSAQAKLDVS